MSANLAEVIQRFLETVDHLDLYNPGVAWGQCDKISDLFIRYALQYGFNFRTYTFYADCVEGCGRRPYGDSYNPAPEIYKVYDNDRKLLRNEAGMIMCTWHCVVDAGECLIDFTSRQYQTATHRMPFPLIIPMNRAMAAHV